MKTAHLFLTGYSTRMISSRKLVRSNDYIVTTNLGSLDKFLSDKCTHYFIATSYRILYRKVTQFMLKTAEFNLNKNCAFVLNKKYFKYIKSINPKRNLIEKDVHKTWLRRFNSEISFKATSQYCGFNIIANLDVKNIYLWGADYILDKPLEGHFYNHLYFENEKHDQFTLNTYQFIKKRFNEKNIIHVCPKGYKSKIFKYINEQ